MDVVAVAGKGGTGKTTTVAALGQAWANTGARVVMLDLDGQASLSDWLTPNRAGPMVEDALLGRAAWPDVLVPVADGLQLAPTGAYALLDVERHIDGLRRRREEFLARALGEAELDADVVLADSPRGLGTLLAVNILEAADHVIVPFDPTGMSLHALAETVPAVQALGVERGTDLLAGLLPTRVASTNLARAVIDEVGRRGLPVLPPVRPTTKAAECVSFHQLLGDYAPNSTAWADYRAVAAAVGERVKGLTGRG